MPRPKRSTARPHENERCQEWCAFLETLRQNPQYLALHLPWSSEDLKFAADTAVTPNVLILAAIHFGLNLKTPGGTLLLLNILADVVFRPEPPPKKGRPKGTKKWGPREQSNLGFRAALIRAKNPSLGYEDMAAKLIADVKEYKHVSPEYLRQLLPDALQAHESKRAALGPRYAEGARRSLVE